MISKTRNQRLRKMSEEVQAMVQNRRQTLCGYRRRTDPTRALLINGVCSSVMVAQIQSRQLRGDNLTSRIDKCGING